MPSIQPKTEIAKAMETKTKSIKKFQDSKEHAIILMSCGRDAVLMVINNPETMKLSEEEQKKKIKEWRKWFFYSLYGTEPDAEALQEAKMTKPPKEILGF